MCLSVKQEKKMRDLQKKSALADARAGRIACYARGTIGLQI